MCIVSTSKEIILGIMRRVYNREGFPDGSVAKKCGFSPWVGKILWRRRWQPTPVFLPGKSHGQRSLEGYSPWGWKESYMTELLNTNPQVLVARDIGKK